MVNDFEACLTRFDWLARDKLSCPSIKHVR